MSDLLRLADNLDDLCKVEIRAVAGEEAIGHQLSAHWHRGMAVGMAKAADLARQMHADARQTPDGAAGDVCGG